MFIPDDEKDGRKEALQKLMGMMKDATGKRLGALGKPVAASMTIEKEPLDASDDDEKMGGSMGGEDDDDGDEGGPSAEDKAMIASLYHKYC